jgi:hypothetical protein
MPASLAIGEMGQKNPTPVRPSDGSEPVSKATKSDWVIRPSKACRIPRFAERWVQVVEAQNADRQDHRRDKEQHAAQDMTRSHHNLL